MPSRLEKIFARRKAVCSSKEEKLKALDKIWEEKLAEGKIVEAVEAPVKKAAKKKAKTKTKES